MTTPEQPPEWAMQRACEELNAEQQHKRDKVRWHFPRDKELSSLLIPARLIAKHEQPPVDPILAAAREAVARMHEKRGKIMLAEVTRSGEGFVDDLQQAAMTAITLYLEREASK